MRLKKKKKSDALILKIPKIQIFNTNYVIQAKTTHGKLKETKKINNSMQISSNLSTVN